MPSVQERIEQQHSGEADGEAMFTGDLGLVQFSDAPLSSFYAVGDWPRRGFGFRSLGRRFGRWSWLSRGELLPERANLLHQIAVLGLQPVQALDDLLQFRRLLGT